MPSSSSPRRAKSVLDSTRASAGLTVLGSVIIGSSAAEAGAAPRTPTGSVCGPATGAADDAAKFVIDMTLPLVR